MARRRRAALLLAGMIAGSALVVGATAWWVSRGAPAASETTCPTQSVQLARLQREFQDASDLRLVSITVDPEHDTPEILARYAVRYSAGDRWWFLTGGKRDIYCLAQEGFRRGVVDPAAPAPPSCGPTLGFGPTLVWANHGSRGLVMHSARAVVVDGAARIRAYHLTTDEESMARLRANLRRLLAAPSRREGRTQ